MIIKNLTPSGLHVDGLKVKQCENVFHLRDVRVLC